MALPNVPTWARWTERLTVGLVAVDGAAAVAGAAGFPGARTTVDAVGWVELLVLLAALVTLIPLRKRLRSAVSADRGEHTGRPLGERLDRGGAIEPAERPTVGRLAWSILATAIVAAWTEALAVGQAARSVLDDQGEFRWPHGWAAVVVVCLPVALIGLGASVKESARWRRIAVDTTLAEAPTTI